MMCPRQPPVKMWRIVTAGGRMRTTWRAVPSTADRNRRPARRGERVSTAPPLANLLSPHGVIQSLLGDELVMASSLDDSPLLEDVNPIGMKNRRQPVCN